MLNKKQNVSRNFKRIIAIALTAALIFPVLLSNVAEAAVTPKLSVAKTANLYVGKKLNINVKNQVKGSKYQWTSSNDKIATVGPKGVVKGLEEGSTTITCTVSAPAKTYTLKTTVKVIKGADQLTISNKAQGKKLVIGDTFKLKTVTTPAKVSDKITWTSADKSIVKVNKNGKLTAVAKGKAKVTAKTASGKKASVNVNVVDAAVVATQKELTEALKNKNLSKITIKTDKEVVFTIPAGTYNTVQMVVNAPNADVINSGVFKGIRINAIKAATWTERANGNSFNLRAPEVRLVIAVGAEVNNITMISAKANIEVNGTVKGTVTVAQNATTELTLGGASATEIKVVINAEGAKLTTSIKVSLTLNANVTLTFEKGSEGSSVTKSNDNIKEDIVNNTDDESIKDVKVESGDTQNPTTGSTSGGGSVLPPVGGGGGTTTEPTKPIEPDEPAIVTIFKEDFEGSTYSTELKQSGTPKLTHVSDVAHEGSKSLLLEDVTKNWYGVDYTLKNTDTTEHTFTISSWIKAKEGSESDDLRIQIVLTGDNLSDEDKYKVAVKETASTEEWTKMEGEWTLKAGESVTVRFTSQDEADGKNVAFYLDDILVTRPGKGSGEDPGELELVNWALAENGGVVSSSKEGESDNLSVINDGQRVGPNDDTGRWRINNGTPVEIEIAFDEAHPVDEINVFSLQASPFTNPVTQDTTSDHVPKAFNAKYWDGTKWISCGQVIDNKNVWVSFEMVETVVTEKIKIEFTEGNDTWIRVLEIEAWGVAEEVETPTPAFSITATPSTQEVTQGEELTTIIFDAENEIGDVTYTLTGELPKGITTNSDISISGTVAMDAEFGDYEVVVKGTDEEGNVAEVTVTIIVTGAEETDELEFEITTPNDGVVDTDNKDVNISVEYATIEVVIGISTAIEQDIVIDGTDKDEVTVSEDKTLLTINTTGIKEGGTLVFTVKVFETGLKSITYNVTVNIKLTAKYVKSLIEALPDVNNIKRAHKTAIEGIEVLYNKLSESDKTAVDNIGNLATLKAKITELESQSIEMIDFSLSAQSGGYGSENKGGNTWEINPNYQRAKFELPDVVDSKAYSLITIKGTNSSNFAVKLLDENNKVVKEEYGKTFSGGVYKTSMPDARVKYIAFENGATIESGTILTITIESVKFDIISDEDNIVITDFSNRAIGYDSILNGTVWTVGKDESGVVKKYARLGFELPKTINLADYSKIIIKGTVDVGDDSSNQFRFSFANDEEKDSNYNTNLNLCGWSYISGSDIASGTVEKAIPSSDKNAKYIMLENTDKGAYTFKLESITIEK